MDSTSAVLAVHGGGEGLICLADRESTDYYCTHEQIERGDQAAGWRLESPDLRFSLARFTVGRQRTITELIGLSAVSTELRPAAPGRIPHAWQRSRDPSAVAAELIERAGISAKATIAAAGDGLRITVAHGHLPRQAAPRWQALQHEFTRLLAPLGAVAETRITQMIPAGRVLAVGERGDFEQLCERLLPLTRDECHEARRRRVERFAYGSEGSKLWWRRLAEIREWCKRCWPAGVPPEYRQRVLFIMCNAIGWSVADPREMPGEIHALATEIMPGMPGWAVDREIAQMQDRLAKDVSERSKLYKYTNKRLKAEVTEGMSRAEKRALTKITKPGLSERQKRRGEIRGRQQQIAIRESDLWARVAELARQELSTRKVAKAVGISQSKAARWMREIRGESPAM